MFKLRQTWSDVFPTKKLYALDVRVKSIDPAWPITAPPPIHVNPAFISKVSVEYIIISAISCSAKKINHFEFHKCHAFSLAQFISELDDFLHPLQ